MNKRRFAVEFVVEGSVIERAIIGNDVYLNKMNIKRRIKNGFESKGLLASELGDCKVSDVKVKQRK